MPETHTPGSGHLPQIGVQIPDIEFWKGQVDRILSMKAEGVAPLQIQIKKLSDMMANRISMLKKGIV